MSSLGIPYIVNSRLHAPREETGRADDEIELDEDAYLRLYQARAELDGIELTPVDACKVPEPSVDCSEVKYGLKCMAGTCAFHIAWDGSMTPCASFRAIVERPLETGFAAAWQSINEYVSKLPVPSECETCVYKKKCTTCFAVHSRDAPVGHASKKICEQTKRLAELGFIKFD